jgi:lysozyme family protein
MKPVYWDKWRADEIKTQAIANLLVDWYWNSGKYGIRLPQKILGVQMDGVVGPKTIAAINSYPDQHRLFQLLWQEREDYFKRIVTADRTQKKFLAGWLNRLNAIRWDCLVMNDKKKTRITF